MIHCGLCTHFSAVSSLGLRPLQCCTVLLFSNCLLQQNFKMMELDLQRVDYLQVCLFRHRFWVETIQLDSTILATETSESVTNRIFSETLHTYAFLPSTLCTVTHSLPLPHSQNHNIVICLYFKGSNSSAKQSVWCWFFKNCILIKLLFIYLLLFSFILIKWVKLYSIYSLFYALFIICQRRTTEFPF